MLINSQLRLLFWHKSELLGMDVLSRFAIGQLYFGMYFILLRYYPCVLRPLRLHRFHIERRQCPGLVRLKWDISIEGVMLSIINQVMCLATSLDL